MSRAMWSASISFGLVSIPVKLHAAIRDRGVRFHQVHAKDRSRVRYQRVNATTGEEVPLKEIVKCYEISPDECVVIDPKELARAAPENTRLIEIRSFVDLDEIDPVYYQRPYYLAPEPRAAKAYRLLLEAMRRTGKVGIAKFVMRGTEYLAAVRPMENVLCLETMHFADEVVAAAEVGGPDAEAKPTDQELKAAQQLIQALSTPFDPSSYPPEHRERLLALVQAKAEGGELARPLEPDEPEPARVLKLVDALRASLDEAGKKAKPVRRKRTA